MKTKYWLSGVLLVLALGAFTVNNQLATPATVLTPSNSVFKNGRFYNSEPMALFSFSKTLGLLKRYIVEDKRDATPSVTLPIKFVSRAQLDALDNNAFFVIKLGHSSVLLKVYGEYWLLDPVFAERASPFSWLGPKRFHAAPITIEDLPPIDKVLISHNHYDHLDKQAVKRLANKTRQFLVPLGVEASLKKWGIKSDKIQSFDWWQEQALSNGLVAFTPTRHFSGRALSDGNNSLWGSWVIKVAGSSVFFSGDSGYFDGFKQIGKKYGAFDVTLIETGAYDKDWPDVHMTPMESVQAHKDVNGKVMIPVHNGTFDLAFHAWYEPLEEVSEYAKLHSVELATPIVGDIIEVGAPIATSPWWRSYMK